MPAEPELKRAIAFFDGQNLFHAAREAFGYSYPNYDPLELSLSITGMKGWRLEGVRFYTGVPDSRDDAFWNHFWAAKLAQMGREGLVTYSRPLRYQNRVVKLPDGSTHSELVGHEKGIDVRIALDIVGAVLENNLDVAIVFSQDQDLSEVADEVRAIAKKQDRWIKMASAFPVSPTSRNIRGINRTDWITIERAVYDKCLDPRDYRPKSPAP